MSYNYIFLFSFYTIGQIASKANWHTLSRADIVFNIEFQKEFVWAASRGELSRYDRNTGTNIVFTADNSDLNHNFVYDVQIDTNNNIWASLFYGAFYKYDGNNWEEFYSLNDTDTIGGILNLIDNNTFNTSANVTQQAFAAVRLANPFGLPTIFGNNQNITNNTIKRVRRGVVTTNWDNINIAENSINLTNIDIVANPTLDYIGINASSCANLSIERNYIYKDGPSPTLALDDRVLGINGQSITNCNITSNLLTRMGSAIRFFNTQMINKVHCNQIDTCRIGVRFDASNIGDQGSAAAAQENTWFCPSTGFFAFSRDNLSPNPNWFTRTLTQSLPYTPGNGFMTPIGFITYLLGNPTNDCEVPCPGCPDQRMADIALRNGEFASLTDDEYYALANVIYNSLQKDSSHMYAGYTSDVVLRNFYDSLAITNIGVLGIVNDLISDSLNAFASVINDWVIPVNHQEENLKLVNEIYLNTWAVGIKNFTSDQQLVLESIANENPMFGGDAVYSARVLLGWDMVDFTTYSIQRTKSQEANFEIENKITIFPNPTNGEINIYLRGEEGISYFYSIENNLGILLNNDDLITGNNVLKLNSLKNGIYFLKVLDNYGTNIGRSKIILNK